MKSKLIKYLGFIIFFLTISAFSHSQVTKLRSTSYSVKLLNDNGEWDDWSDDVEANVLIIFDGNKDRFTVYSSTTQVFDIAEYLPKSENEKGNTVRKYFCIDKDGDECLLRYIDYTETNGQNTLNQLYIHYNEVIVLYYVYTLD